MWIALALAVMIAVFLFIKWGHTKDSANSPILAHITSWPEVYLWLPLAILNVILLAKFSHFLTGRTPIDNGIDWVEKGEHVLTCVFLVVIMSIWKESNNGWMTPEQRWAERQGHPSIGVAEKIKQLGLVITFAYILLH